MDEYDASTYGERIAEIFDELYGKYENVDAMAKFLAPFAKNGRALELGIGTGRVAIPLAAHGVEVHGIDASPAMVAKMRAKPGGEKIPVTPGDFADIPVQGLFDLIYIAFNTFFALPTQEAQVKCFQATAQHLRDSGVFVLENFVPDLTRLDRGQRTETIAAGVTRFGLMHKSTTPSANVASFSMSSSVRKGYGCTRSNFGMHGPPSWI